jgi:hypothetical protein
MLVPACLAQASRLAKDSRHMRIRPCDLSRLDMWEFLHLAILTDEMLIGPALHLAIFLYMKLCRIQARKPIQVTWYPEIILRYHVTYVFNHPWRRLMRNKLHSPYPLLICNASPPKLHNTVEHISYRRFINPQFLPLAFSSRNLRIDLLYDQLVGNRRKRLKTIL